MALPDVTINFSGNPSGAIDTGDGVCGLVEMYVCEDESEFETLADDPLYDTPFLIRTMNDLSRYGIEEEQFPLVYHDVKRFFEKADSGEQLYLLIMLYGPNIIEEFPEERSRVLDKFIAFSGNRIRILGFNSDLSKFPDDGLHWSFYQAAIFLCAIVWTEKQIEKMLPLRIICPFIYYMEDPAMDPDEVAEYWKGILGAPRLSLLVVSDKKLQNNFYAPAVGLTLGTLASMPVNQSLGRVRKGAVSEEGWIENGKSIESNLERISMYHDAGFIIFRTYPGKTGYYFNGDPTMAASGDPITNIHTGRVMDKALLLVYHTYVNELLDSIETDPDGSLPANVCSYYEGLITRAVNRGMQGQIDGFTARIDPAQNVLSTSRLHVDCSLRPKGVLQNITINLGFATR